MGISEKSGFMLTVFLRLVVFCCSSTDAGDAGELDFSGLLKKR